MWTKFMTVLAGLGIIFLISHAIAQPPGRPGESQTKGNSSSALITRMMAFDTNKDGKLTRDEITDDRLLRLFDRADTNKDGIVTQEELKALADKEEADNRGPGRGGFGGSGGPPRGPGGPDGIGGRGPGGPPRPGQILPGFLQDFLELTADQKKELEALQKDVDAKLSKLLNADQKKLLEQMQQGPGGRGPGGPGGPGGRGPGGPGGRPGEGPRPPDRPELQR